MESISKYPGEKTIITLSEAVSAFSVSRKALENNPGSHNHNCWQSNPVHSSAAPHDDPGQWLIRYWDWTKECERGRSTSWVRWWYGRAGDSSR